MKAKQTQTPEYSSFLLRISRAADGGRQQFQLQDVSNKSVHRFSNPVDLIQFITRQDSRKSD